MSSQPLNNPRHEKFAGLVASGIAAGPAYGQAGFTVKTVRARDVNASRLLSKADVASRIEELKRAISVEAVRASGLSKADVLQMLVEQHLRNIGEVMVTHRAKVTKGRQKGKMVETTQTEYDGRAATQTIKLLMDEFGLGEAGSANAGARDEAMGVRQGFNDPNVIEAIESVRRVRGMIVIQGSAKEVSQADALEALAKGKKA